MKGKNGNYCSYVTKRLQFVTIVGLGRHRFDTILVYSLAHGVHTTPHEC